MTDEWQTQRRMTPRQYKTTIHQLGLDQVTAGRYLGITGRHSRRYIAGHARIPTSIALLLRSLVAHQEAPIVPAAKEGDN